MNLYDSYNKAQRLKKGLSADAVQGLKLDASQTPQVCTEFGRHLSVLVFSYI